MIAGTEQQPLVEALARELPQEPVVAPDAAVLDPPGARVEFPPLGDESYNVDERFAGAVEVTGRASWLNAFAVRLTHQWRLVLRNREPVEVEIGGRKLR